MHSFSQPHNRPFIYPSNKYSIKLWYVLHKHAGIPKDCISFLSAHAQDMCFAVVRVPSVEVLNFPVTFRDNWTSFNVCIGPRARKGMTYALMIYTCGYNWVFMRCNTTKDITQSHGHVLCIDTSTPHVLAIALTGPHKHTRYWCSLDSRLNIWNCLFRFDNLLPVSLSIHSSIYLSTSVCLRFEVLHGG
jgi:hypothetical protein